MSNETPVAVYQQECAICKTRMNAHGECMCDDEPFRPWSPEVEKSK